MEILQLDKENGKDWDDFCAECCNAWFWHTTHWMNYVLQYSPECNPVQMSFLVKENNRIMALCPLILETRGGNKEFSFNSFAVPAPALREEGGGRKQKKVLDFIFAYIDAQARAQGVKRASFRFSPLVDVCLQPKGRLSDYLFKYGYLDATFNTQILDVSPEPEQIKRDVRKGHKYDINRASRVLDAQVYDARSIDRATFDRYCELHHRDAGRVTRPQRTFDMMYDWIKRGYAVLVGITLKGSTQFVGFSYHVSYRDAAVYGSSCSDPDFGEMPIAHLALWESIRWLHDNGIRFFELGWQFYGSEFHNRTSEKECQISKFKRGFGGGQVPQIVGEKYYDPDFFEKEYSRKMENYKEYITRRRGQDVNGE